MMIDKKRQITKTLLFVITKNN